MQVTVQVLGLDERGVPSEMRLLEDEHLVGQLGPSHLALLGIAKVGQRLAVTTCKNQVSTKRCQIGEDEGDAPFLAVAPEQKSVASTITTRRVESFFNRW